MIGKVEADDALLEIEFVELQGRGKLAIEFVVDTGFKGDLTLPPEVIEALSLPLLRAIKAKLADDSIIETNLHIATIIRRGIVTEVGVLERV